MFSFKRRIFKSIALLIQHAYANNSRDKFDV